MTSFISLFQREINPFFAKCRRPFCTLRPERVAARRAHDPDRVRMMGTTKPRGRAGFAAGGALQVIEFPAINLVQDIDLRGYHLLSLVLGICAVHLPPAREPQPLTQSSSDAFAAARCGSGMRSSTRICDTCRHRSAPARPSACAAHGTGHFASSLCRTRARKAAEMRHPDCGLRPSMELRRLDLGLRAPTARRLGFFRPHIKRFKDGRRHAKW